MPTPVLEEYNTFFYIASIVVGIIVIVILSIILSIYVKSYREIKSKFTKGLILFATLFILQEILMVLFTISNFGFRAERGGGPFLVLEIIKCIAFGMLLKITRE
jgi:hypothetical protein